MNTTDSLLKEAVEGDAVAFNLLHERFAKRLERHVSSALGPRLAALVEPEDVVQEVFAEVFTHIDRIEQRGKGTFWRLLVTIARRRIIDHGRRAAVRPESHAMAPTDAEAARESVPASRGTGPLTTLLRAEEQELCRRAFQELPESAREIIWLRLVEERSAREISGLTGKSTGAVWVWFHRALKAWHEKFDALRGR
jgi:RNA polymerase sigma factor (sigma-70 family)